MKIITSLILAIVFFGSASFVEATVGGPTYVYDLKYNSADSSVYYTTISESGRGCPPELIKINVESGAQSTVLSCAEGEKLYNNGQYNPSLIEEEIYAITQNYRYLPGLNLKSNGISIDIEYVRTEKFEEEFVFRNHFTAKVYQNGTKVGEFPLTGCTREQPFTFAGYSIPGLSKRFVLVSSAKSDCMEGGYIGESLKIISGVNLTDRSEVPSSYKSRTPLVPSEANLIVYEKDSASPTTTKSPSPSTTTSTPSGIGSQVTIAIIGLVFLIVGAVLGYSARGKK